jgi:hypothetical protein
MSDLFSVVGPERTLVADPPANDAGKGARAPLFRRDIPFDSGHAAIVACSCRSRAPTSLYILVLTTLRQSRRHVRRRRRGQTLRRAVDHDFRFELDEKAPWAIQRYFGCGIGQLAFSRPAPLRSSLDAPTPRQLPGETRIPDPAAVREARRAAAEPTAAAALVAAGAAQAVAAAGLVVAAAGTAAAKMEMRGLLQSKAGLPTVQTAVTAAPACQNASLARRGRSPLPPQE